MKRRIHLGRISRRTGIKVGDIMTRNLIMVNPETSIEECVQKMLDNKIGTVLVSNKGTLRGIITKMDIIKLIPRCKVFSKEKAKDAMITKVRTINPDADLYKAMILMQKTKFKKIPVVEGNKVVGMLNAKDIMKLQPQLIEHMIEALQIREESEKLRRLDKYRSVRISSGIEPRGTIEGPCEECGNYGLLDEYEGRLLCSECKDLYDFD